MAAAHDTRPPSGDPAPPDDVAAKEARAPTPSRHRVLYVGSDRAHFQTLQRNLEDAFAVEYAIGPSVAIGILQNRGPFASVVADINKPPATTRKLLARIHEVCPETVRIWVSDPSDLGSVVESANEIDVFRCLARPYTWEQLRKSLDAASAQSQLRAAQNAILHETLGGSVKVLTDVLAFVSPTVFSRTSRVRHYVRQLSQSLDLSEAWQVEIAAMLCRIGCVTLSAETVDRHFSGRDTSDSENASLRSLPQVSAAMLGGIPRIEAIVRIIEGAEKPHQAANRSELTGEFERERKGSQILRAASDFDHLLVCGRQRETALEEMRRSEQYDPEVLTALESAESAESHWVTKSLLAAHLAPGMVIAEDVHMRGGTLMARRGDEVDASMIDRMNDVAKSKGLQEPFRVLVPAAPDEHDEDEDRFG